MARIRIRRCTLRIVRRGSWAWGGDRDEWLRLARRVLPALLARRIAAHFAAAAVHAAHPGPIRLTVRCSIAELRRAAEDAGQGSLAVKLDAALAAAVGLDRRIGNELPALAAKRSARVLDHPAATTSEIDSLPGIAAPVLRLLQRLSADGRLRLYLERLAEADLWRIHDAIVDVCAPTTSTPLPVASDAAAASSAAVGAQTAQLEAILRHRIDAFASNAGKTNWRPPWKTIVADLDRTFPLPAVSMSRPVRRKDAESRGRGATAGGAAPGAVPRRHTLALPFLLLAPLARRGTLDALALAVDATGIGDGWPALATALAYKVLPPPDRGWRRSPLDLDTAAAFADAVSPVPDAEIERVAVRMQGALDGVLHHLELSAAADATDGFVLWRGPRETFLLFATPGLFPIGLYTSVAACAGAIAGHERPVFVDAGAPRAGLSALDARNCRFVTAAAPSRHEPWRAMRAPDGRRWWTNDFSRADLTAAASRLDANYDDAARIWPSLFTDRPAVARRDDLDLDRVLTLAAAIALGDVAWNLWREREPTTPLLTLERFGDFDAHVASDPGGVHVRVPLGRRHGDLMRHGLLGDLTGVPWLDRRRVRVTGG